MEQNETILVSGRLVAEFEDDASPFLAGAAEYVGASEMTAKVPASSAIPPANDAIQANPG